MSDKVVLTCALTGVLTDPSMANLPVTPEQMAEAAQQAWDQGATIVHCHFRDQHPGMGYLPTWDVDVVKSIIDAIRDRVPGIIINQSTGLVGPDISGPVACLEATKPEMAACNAGSLNYLKLKSDGTWAWPPTLFDNPVEKVQAFLDAMKANDVVPEFECFDSGIVRSVALYKKAGMFEGDPHISLVMGVASGQPAKPEWIPLLKNEMLPGTHWQVICVGRKEVWDLQRKALEEGGNVRTGLEDTFYLPSGEKARNNGELVEALAGIVREVGREIATAEEARAILGLKG
ncbi:MAG: 3-keto-5-aminohexanoate cleavage protein [Deltaproteobacteria bacterium]|nr:3-keto-5-aminohexanoate cleavage protein [Deltaproteobacteria bacterium]MBW1923419.1 3-keto-5-aminohexanoate cleavage protein [Deltaproteobacteria bacterium]MBW1948831.1 3-keto-5-aminohexanoate cleavage protein [Deltaproteobacteria bacterium]MBW2008278.1 3-keto-5-aminohexanoate cleavage protein [Deltaproteobacteria bacterium]MBW2102075.1 3-keto-5-aminohexanoate cleavage protein [Deltaproteobacteria bacterium]